MLAVIMNDLAKHVELKYIDTFPPLSLSLFEFSQLYYFFLSTAVTSKHFQEYKLVQFVIHIRSEFTFTSFILPMEKRKKE